MCFVVLLSYWFVYVGQWLGASKDKGMFQSRQEAFSNSSKKVHIFPAAEVEAPN